MREVGGYDFFEPGCAANFLYTVSSSCAVQVVARLLHCSTCKLAESLDSFESQESSWSRDQP
jgi:hypothetical protein